MSISYPLASADFWEQLRFANRPEFVLQQNRKQSGDGAGNTLSAFYGAPKWTVNVAVSGGRHSRNLTQEADIKHLEGRDGTFLAYDIRRPYPDFDPTGAFLSGGSLVEVGDVAASGSVVTGLYTVDGVSTTLSAAVTVDSDAGTYFDVAGVLQTASADVVRVDHDPVTHAVLGILAEKATSNQIRNNTMVGAAAGTPGTMPTNWSANAGSGVAVNVIGTGTENGIDYIDLQIAGTASGTVTGGINFEASTQIVAAAAETWTGSCWLKIASGSIANFTNFRLGFREGQAAGAFVQDDLGTDIDNIVTSTLTRYTYTTALSGVATARVLLKIYFSIANGVTVDGTVRIGLPQMEKLGSASMPIKTTSAAVTRAADALTFKSVGTNDWVLTFDNDATQAINNQATSGSGGFSPGAAALNRPRIKGWTATRDTQPSASSVQVKSKGSNNRSLALKGLPPFFQITKGDKISILYGSTRRFLFEAMESVTADIAGETAEFEIQPFIPTSVAVDDAVTLIKPCGKFKIVAGSYSPSSGRGDMSDGIGFSMISVP